MYANYINQSAYATTYTPYMDELKGLADGIVASGANLFVPGLGRKIDSRDLWILNLMPELACSSFTVWGKNTSTGGTLIGRNLDYNYDSSGLFLNRQLIISYSPTGGTDFVVLSFPGVIGAHSGMNAYGVTITSNTGNTGNPTGSGPFHSSLLVSRYILETTNLDNFAVQPLNTVNFAQEYHPTILLVSSPYNAVSDAAYVLEDSYLNGTNANTLRRASDTDPGASCIIATNHYINLQPPPPASDDSVVRYNTIRSALLSAFTSGDSQLDSREALSILDSVAYGSSRTGTLTAFIARPDSREFDVSFAQVAGGTFTKATLIPMQTYTWASLFPNHGSDSTAPTITLTSPSNGQSVSATISLSAVATDDTGVAGVQFWLDGSKYGGELTTPPYTLNMDTTPITDGSHTLAATARDGAGNVGTSSVITVTVANLTAPVIALTSPSNGQVLSGTVMISASASAAGGIAGVQFLIDGAKYGPELITPPYSISFDTTTLTNGAHSLSAAARDTAGHVAVSSSVGVTISNSLAQGPWTGQYYSSTLLKPFNKLVFTRSDPVLNFNWSSAIPDPHLAKTLYAVRWTTTVVFPASQTYTFTGRTDDGMRIWI